MSVAAAIALLTEIIAVAPQALSTGQQVIRLANDGWKALSDAIGDKDVTPEEINELVAKIVANSVEIQAIP